MSYRTATVALEIMVRPAGFEPAAYGFEDWLPTFGSRWKETSLQSPLQKPIMASVFTTRILQNLPLHYSLSLRRKIQERSTEYSQAVLSRNAEIEALIDKKEEDVIMKWLDSL